LPRYFLKGTPQHVIQRGNNRQAIFRALADYRYFSGCLEEAAEKYGLAVHAYVLMTNHVHLLATPSTPESLPKTLQSIGRRYVQYFNRARSRTGTLWEGRYRATLVDSTRYLLTCMRYIESNPVRAGIVGHPRDYQWSSYRNNAEGQADPLVTSHVVYRQLHANVDSRRKSYRQLFRHRIPDAELNEIRSATHKAWVLGSPRFKTRAEKATGRRVTPLAKGRPRKIV